MSRFFMWLAALSFGSIFVLVSACKTVPVAGECPENAGLRCLTRKVCQEDKKRGCLRCACDGQWFESQPYKQGENLKQDPDNPQP
ncbi:MAG: hypothetical protein JRF33_26770 [Deltaproteobacteria bacterium]|nr:hypothetical protein [Deltaproteobacteria bacterium]